MKKRTVILFIIAPLIYFIIGSFFLFRHIASQESFSRIIGNIEITGKTSVASRLSDPKVKRLNVEYNGIQLHFRQLTPLQIVTEDNIQHNLSLEDYSFENNKLTLRFKYDIILVFEPDIHSQEVVMKTEIPQLIPAVQAIILPLQIQRNFSIQNQNANGTEWVIGNEETSFFMATPPNSDLSQKGNSLMFQLGSPLGNDIVISPERGSGKTAITWYEQEGASLGLSIYNENLEEYWTTAYSGWQRRFDIRNGQWSYTDDEKYSESALAAYLAESVRRGQYSRVQSQAMGAFDRDTTLLTDLTCTYLDNLLTRINRADRVHRAVINNISDKLENNDLSVFSDPDLYHFVEDFGPYYNMSNLAELATTLPEENPDLHTALNIMEFLLDARESGNAIEGDSDIIDYLESDYLLPKILWIGEGLYIFDEDGNANLYETIRCGVLFQRTAEQYNKETLLSIGRKMVLSGLYFSDQETAAIPETLFFEGMETTPGPLEVYPEDIYSYLRTHEEVSRRISLNEELGQGSWLLTAAPKATVSHTPRETRINVDFPRGEPHHMVLRGIKPFDRIIMHGIRWNTDQRFEQYSDGWYYDEATETIYFKITHRVTTENIQIIY